MKKDRILIPGVTERVDGSVDFMGEFTVDADGSPRAYGPPGTKPLDYLANAGYPGNWWGIATNSKGVPIIQGPNDPFPGYYVSTTSYKNPGFKHGDPRRELNSEIVPFIVVPLPVIRMVKGIVLGCKAMVIDEGTGLSYEAMVGDAGPATHLGEGSIALAKGLKLPSNPKNGGSSQRRFRNIFWPGIVAPGHRLFPLSK